MGIATALVGSAVIGGIVANRSAKKAASAQKDAARQAAETSEAGLQQQREIFNQITEQTRPARQVGGQALNNLAVLFGLEPALPEGVSAQQAIQAQVAREQPIPQPGETPAATTPAAPTPVPTQTINTPFGQIQIPANLQNIAQGGQNVTGSTVPGFSVPFPGSDQIRGGLAPQRLTATQAQSSPGAAALGAPDAAEAPPSLASFGKAGRRAEKQIRVALQQGVPLESIAAAFPGLSLAPPPEPATPAAPLQGPTANAPTLPIGGQQTQLQQTGFQDVPNQAAPTREGVLQNLRDFPVSTFLQEEGMRGIQGSAAARGGLQSGRTLKGLVEFNQSLAQAQSIQPFIGGLQSLAGVGQSAGQTQSGAASGFSGAVGQNTNNLANLALASGDARASAFQGQNQAIQGTLGNITQLALLRNAGVV
ncbi:MAG TPA: hypothetical protein VIG24_12485 [Acidimicrobiia bacterium]